MILDVVKVLVPSILAFSIGIAGTPILTHYLYKYKVWKKKGGKIALDGKDARVFNSIHRVTDGNTPRMGGVVIWSSVFITVVSIWIIAQLLPDDLILKLDFLSRDQTWIPLFTMMFGALVGLINDYYDILEKNHHGLSLKRRVLLITFVSFFIGWWFYDKLEISSIGIPFNGSLELGLLFIPFFILVTLGLYAGGVIDGIDGLSGGVFASIFSAYAVIAFSQDQINLAAFCATVVGAILAFLWFNIPPARFYMTETGTMALTITIAVVAFMTDTLGGGVGVSVLPVIAFLLVLTVASNLIQIASKKFRNGKKIFLVAPIHHHFEALGWSSAKVVMRYWIVGVVFALFGIIISFIA